MALNLVRNSRVYFTTNVDTYGTINTSGFTTSNTQEIQVLDGFTFSQNTNQDTVTINEAGGAPARGQRSFNTSLAPVDFSFSSYLRPYNTGSEITAEESVLWNALFSATTYKTTSSVTAGTSFAATYSSTAGTVTLTATGTLSHSLAQGDIVTLSGITTSPTSEYNNINAPAVVTSISTTGTSGGSAVFTLLAPKFGTSTTLTVSGTTFTVFTSSWANIKSDQSIATTAGSNLNKLQVFGMIFQVDNVIYAVDNCAMNQAMIDFGLDAIATIQWTGQATALREISLTGNITVDSATVTNLPSTENIFVGNVVQYVGAGGLTSQAGSAVTIATITGPTSLTLTGGTLTTTGTASSFKVFNYSSTATIGTVVGSASPWTAPVTGLTSTQGISVGDTITATSGAGTWGTGVAKVKSVDSSTAITVTFTGGSAPVAGGITAVYTTIATLSGAATTLTAAAKNTSAPYITNKLSTVDFALLNALGSTAAGTTYAIALTGGSITINNNINYITPANIGVINVPNVYYTGTRSITGTLNAYLKTGAGVGGTGQLLTNMLDAKTTAIEPMASLSIAIGGKSNTTKVVLEMPSVTFGIPTIDVQQVISTAINFTAAGSTLSSTANANVFAVDKTNDLLIRYYAA